MEARKKSKSKTNKSISTTDHGISRRRTSDNSCHRDTSPGDTQSACKASAHAAPGCQGVKAFAERYRAAGMLQPIGIAEASRRLDREAAS